MSDITLSPGVRQNLLSLQNTADLLNVTQNRLATGKKVNNAFDNPVAFFSSQSLSNRASDLSSLLDQIGQAQQTLNAANQGLTSLTSLLQSALSTAKQAQSAAEPALGLDTGTLAGGTTVGTAGAGNLVVAVTGGSSYTLAIAATDTAASIISNFNAISGLGSAGAITATTDSTGHLQLAANPTSSFTITADATTAAVGLTVDSSTNFTATSTTNSSRNTLQGNYNSLLSQIDQLAGDASYNGVNLLNGNNLKVVFNETNTSSLTISGVTFNSAGLGLTALSGSGNTGFQSDTTIANTITAINAALSAVRTQAVTFGTNSSTIQTRSDFTKNLINTLQTGSDQLVLADQNQESANLLTLQTRQQLSISALSISNQAQQAVLKLFP
ncbi:MAG TPA: flagellin [Xanthobacteraceae bacterium]|jgi:flagellin-like hook-associated protein FlgL